MDETARGHATDQRRVPGWIALARHGRPRADRSVRMDWRGYEAWWAQYDRDGLATDQPAPEGLCTLAARADVLFSSVLPRAIETAEAVARGREIIRDAVFIEAPLPPPPIPGNCQPAHWEVLARISWWLGAARGGETRRQAELRAEAAVATVAARALRGENVLLCAHGWFNRMMRPVLLRQGWRCVEDNGDAYWAYRLYRRPG